MELIYAGDIIVDVVVGLGLKLVTFGSEYL